MPRIQYAGVGSIPPAPTITIVNASTTDKSSGSYSAYLQSRNRAGYNAFSSRVDFTITAGQGVRVTIPASVRQPAWDLHEIVLSLAKNSTNPINASVVATYPGFDVDEVTPRVLPVLIDLTEDEHLEIARSLSDRSALPVRPVHGMRRYLESEARTPIQ